MTLDCCLGDAWDAVMAFLGLLRDPACLGDSGLVPQQLVGVAEACFSETRTDRQENGGRRMQRAILLPPGFFANRAVVASPQE
jgi:hypothetical protein